MTIIDQELKGTAEQLTGRATRRVGEFIGDPLMQAKGETAEAHGKARVEVSRATGRIKAHLQRAVRVVLSGISALAGSTENGRKDRAARAQGQ